MFEYRRKEAAVFRKTRERFGELSNMAAGFPLMVNGHLYRTAEALYQCCRFPNHPDVQREIMYQRSPMAAKMVGKPHRIHTRGDWDETRVEIMWWVLRVKLALHWDAFSNVLLSTEDLPIVEESHRDAFWGTIAKDDDVLRGENALGRLLTELRDRRCRLDAERLRRVLPPKVPDFLLLAEPVGIVNDAQLIHQRSDHQSVLPGFIET
ncbi:MAG: NADAR family protein [Thermomicrobiales bacterium]|nr:NADAR family protein [Thermomicrobiales bacterium]